MNESNVADKPDPSVLSTSCRKFRFSRKYECDLPAGRWQHVETAWARVRHPHNDGVSKSPAILFVAAIFLAGCATTPTPPEEVISSPPIMSNETSSLNWSDANLIKKFSAPRSTRPVAPTARTNPSPAAPMTTWTSLNRWATENKIGQPHLISRTPVATYAIGR